MGAAEVTGLVAVLGLTARAVGRATMETEGLWLAAGDGEALGEVEDDGLAEAEVVTLADGVSEAQFDGVEALGVGDTEGVGDAEGVTDAEGVALGHVGDGVLVGVLVGATVGRTVGGTTVTVTVGTGEAVSVGNGSGALGDPSLGSGLASVGVAVGSGTGLADGVGFDVGFGVGVTEWFGWGACGICSLVTVGTVLGSVGVGVGVICEGVVTGRLGEGP
jgi:hypothetical protein